MSTQLAKKEPNYFSHYLTSDAVIYSGLSAAVVGFPLAWLWGTVAFLIPCLLWFGGVALGALIIPQTSSFKLAVKRHLQKEKAAAIVIRYEQKWQHEKGDFAYYVQDVYPGIHEITRLKQELFEAGHDIPALDGVEASYWQSIFKVLSFQKRLQDQSTQADEIENLKNQIENSLNAEDKILLSRVLREKEESQKELERIPAQITLIKSDLNDLVKKVKEIHQTSLYGSDTERKNLVGALNDLSAKASLEDSLEKELAEFGIR